MTTTNTTHAKGNEMTDARINKLGTIAAETAMQAAAEYIKANGLKVVDYEVACEALRYYTKSRLGQALEDAKQAIDCGMVDAATMTFKASMAMAGIEAAKEFGFPLDYQSA